MRPILRQCLVAAILLTASCARLVDEPLTKEDVPKASTGFSAVATTKFRNDVVMNVLVSKTTGCQFLWANGQEAGTLSERLDHGKPMCGAMKTPAFEMLSYTSLGQLSLYVIRDIGTGCRWIWSDGDSATDLDPETDVSGQICDGTPGRRNTPPPAPSPPDDDD